MNSSVYFSPSSKTSSTHSIPPLFSIPPVSSLVSYPFHVLPRSPPPFLLHSILSSPVIQFRYSQSSPLLHFSLSPIPQSLSPIPPHPSISTSINLLYPHFLPMQSSSHNNPPNSIPEIILSTSISSPSHSDNHPPYPHPLHSPDSLLPIRFFFKSSPLHRSFHSAFTSPLSLFSKPPTQLSITKKHQISLQTPLLCNIASHNSLPREWPPFTKQH